MTRTAGGGISHGGFFQNHVRLTHEISDDVENHLAHCESE